VDDDPTIRRVIADYLSQAGMSVRQASTVDEALKMAAAEDFDLGVLDYHLPDGTALDFLRSRSMDAPLPSIVFTGQGTIDLAVRAMQLGAEHFLTKPVRPEELREVILSVLRRLAENTINSEVRLKASARPLDPFVGGSRQIAEVRALAEAIKSSGAPVLILGETGTGKSVLARWLHENGPRSTGPFVDLNCAGLSRELAEADLFGHEKGAFTGANASKKGLLEIAHKGDIFLDEIGDLDLSVQPKLLKVLEEKTYRRVGDVRNRQSDVRIIAATHRDLSKMSSEGSFRSDLLFRINTVTFQLPALRERPEDLLPLTECILEALCRRTGRVKPALSKEALATIRRHTWPGNLRELRNALERALLFCRGEVIHELTVSTDSSSSSSAPPGTPSEQPVTSLLDAERQMIEHALRLHEGRVDRAAEALQIPRSSLYVKIKKFGLSRR
jgi:DNA-binding NtrC family response regulator